jgi:hypothetical protein
MQWPPSGHLAKRQWWAAAAGDRVQGEGFTSLLPYSMGILWGADQSSLATDSGSALVLNAREARAGSYLCKLPSRLATGRSWRYLF